jgi:hypothetical protein
MMTKSVLTLLQSMSPCHSETSMPLLVIASAPPCVRRLHTAAFHIMQNGFFVCLKKVKDLLRIAVL